MKISCYLFIEMYDFTYTNGGKRFSIGVVNNKAKQGRALCSERNTFLDYMLIPDEYWVYNLISVRLKDEYDFLDFEKFKINLKKEIKKYKNKNNVLFITGYNRVIKSIEENFDFNINQCYRCYECKIKVINKTKCQSCKRFNEFKKRNIK